LQAKQKKKKSPFSKQIKKREEFNLRNGRVEREKREHDRCCLKKEKTERLFLPKKKKNARQSKKQRPKREKTKGKSSQAAGCRRHRKKTRCSGVFAPVGREKNPARSMTPPRKRAEDEEKEQRKGTR